MEIGCKWVVSYVTCLQLWPKLICVKLCNSTCLEVETIGPRRLWRSEFGFYASILKNYDVSWNQGILKNNFVSFFRLDLKFSSTNICYCLLSVPQNQFKTGEKDSLIGQWFFIFSFKKRENKYLFVLQNSKCQISKSPDNIHTCSITIISIIKNYLNN